VSKVIYLVTKQARALTELTTEFPALAPTHDRFCEDCNDFVAINKTHDPKHNVRTLSPEGQMAATIDVMWRWS
jgi:hypothetical protein